MGIFEGADNGGLTPVPSPIRTRWLAFWAAVALIAAVAALASCNSAYAAPGSLSSCSGTVGVTSTAIAFPGAGRTGPSVPQVYVEITNPHATNSLWINPTGAAAAANTADSGLISPGGYVWFDGPVQPGAINILASGADTPFTCWYR